MPRQVTSNEIVYGQRRVTADTALRLAGYVGMSAPFGANLQSRFDLESEGDSIGTAPDLIQPPRSA